MACLISTAALLAWTALALAAALSPGPDTVLVAGHAVAGIVAGGVYYAALIGFGAVFYLMVLQQLASGANAPVLGDHIDRHSFRAGRGLT